MTGHCPHCGEPVMLVPISALVAMENPGCSCDTQPALIGPDDAHTEPRLARLPGSSTHAHGPAATAIAEGSDSHVDDVSEYSTRFGGELIATPHPNR